MLRTNISNKIYDIINIFDKNYSQNDILTKTNLVVGNYILYVKKSTNLLQISIIEKRGMYKCEDDIFYIKKIDNCNYEFWDTENYIKKRICSLQEISNILEKACPKINLMYKALQQNRISNPALLDTDEPLFCLNNSNCKHHILKCDQVTRNITIIKEINYDKLNNMLRYKFL